VDWPDNHHLNAAIGWLTLGNTVEARADLERLTPGHRALPDALAVEWQLLATERRWKDAAKVADRWVEAAPERPEAWIQRSFALHEGGLTQEAWDKLLPAATLFPGIHTIAYNLACYACQLGNLDAARRWLRRSMLIIKDKAKRRMWTSAAQQDRDLEPLWAEIRAGKLG
jgi:Flp pilus assembly protein TadD